MCRRLVRSRMDGSAVIVRICLLDLRRVAFVFFKPFLAFHFFSCVLFSSHISFPHFIMAAVSYDIDVAFHDADDLLVGDGGGPITPRARPLKAWIALVQALLPRHACVVELSLREQIPVRTLHRWKALASKKGVNVGDPWTVRKFVLHQKGMRLDPRKSGDHRRNDADQLRLFRQALQPGAPLQSLAAVMNVSKSRLVRARSKCIKQNVDRDSVGQMQKFLQDSGILGARQTKVLTGQRDSWR